MFVTEARQKPTKDNCWMISASSVLQGLRRQDERNLIVTVGVVERSLNCVFIYDHKVCFTTFNNANKVFKKEIKFNYKK